MFGNALVVFRRFVKTHSYPIKDVFGGIGQHSAVETSNAICAEIEKLILSHPDVYEAIVFEAINILNPGGSTHIEAIVVCKNNTTLESAEIIEFCRDNLNNAKTPAVVVVSRSNFPKTPSGAVNRSQIISNYIWSAGQIHI
jgi:acyl-CoA synthetase (AMP-forming)/AMP-acid ligase II